MIAGGAVRYFVLEWAGANWVPGIFNVAVFLEEHCCRSVMEDVPSIRSDIKILEVLKYRET